MSFHPRLAALGLLVCALTAEAAPKVTIAPITGDKRSQVHSQISAALCRTYTCVASSRVFTKKKPDWNKMKSAGVTGLLVGGVAKAKSGKGKEVQLSWLDKPGKAAQSWSFPLTSAGKLTSSSLQTLGSDVGNLTSGGGAAGVGAVGALAAGTTAAAGDTLATTPPTTGPGGAGAMAAGAAAEPLPLPVTPTPPPPGEKSLADTPVAVDAGANQGYEAPRHQWRFAVELGADFLNKNLSYGNQAAGSILRPYSASLFIAPHLRLELFPLAFFGDGLFAGIGLFGDYSLSVGLKSNFSNGSDNTNKGTTYNNWQAGLEWRLRFWKDSDLAFVPFYAYGKQHFLTDGDPQGVGFAGLPQMSLWGHKIGLRVDIPISSGFWIIVGGDYILWKTKALAVQDSSGNNSTSFTGSSSGFEAELGFHIGIAGPFSIRIYGMYSTTSFTFDDGQPGAAGSASDRYLGGRAMLRLQF